MLMRVSAFATVPAPIKKGSLPTHVQGGPGWCCVIRAQVCGLLRNVIRKPRRGQEEERGEFGYGKKTHPDEANPITTPKPEDIPQPQPQAACHMHALCLFSASLHHLLHPPLLVSPLSTLFSLVHSPSAFA